MSANQKSSVLRYVASIAYKCRLCGTIEVKVDRVYPDKQKELTFGLPGISNHHCGPNINSVSDLVSISNITKAYWDSDNELYYDENDQVILPDERLYQF